MEGVIRAKRGRYDRRPLPGGSAGGGPAPPQGIRRPGGDHERAGRRKEDGMAGDHSPGDRREGGRPPLRARAGPGVIDSFCIAALVVFWSIASAGGGGVDQFLVSKNMGAG